MRGQKATLWNLQNKSGGLKLKRGRFLGCDWWIACWLSRVLINWHEDKTISRATRWLPDLFSLMFLISLLVNLYANYVAGNVSETKVWEGPHDEVDKRGQTKLCLLTFNEIVSEDNVWPAALIPLAPVCFFSVCQDSLCFRGHCVRGVGHGEMFSHSETSSVMRLHVSPAGCWTSLYFRLSSGWSSHHSGFTSSNKTVTAEERKQQDLLK